MSIGRNSSSLLKWIVHLILFAYSVLSAKQSTMFYTSNNN